MVETRRKSRANPATGGDAEGSSPAADQSQSFIVPIPEDFNVDAFSDIFPDFNIHSPSPGSLLELYRFLIAQTSDIEKFQRELDEARAEAEKKDVELDQALQDREQASKDLESQMESVQEDLHQVKQERDQLLASQSELQTRVTSLSSTHSSTSAEVNSLKRRLEDTEHEKRDLVGVISRLKQEGTQREEEVQALRADLKQARQDHHALENQVREIRSTETSTKFKLESLTQQLQLSQSEAERVNAELVTKSEEFGNYRRIKQAELTTLQANYDALTQTHNSAQATLKALQSAHSSQTHQLTQALTKVQDLTGQLAEQEATYSSEANALRRLVTMLEEREKQAKDIVESIEREWAGVGERADSREDSLREEIERERKGREAAENKIEQLEKVLDKIGRGELPLPGRGTPVTPSRRASGAFDEVTEGLMGLSPTVAMASKAQKSGKGFTEVYADYIRLQEDYAQKTAEYDHMDRTLTAVLAQIEERAPILSQQRVEYERLQSEASQLASELAQALSERDTQTNLAQDNAQRLAKSVQENELLQQQLNDLGRQVRALLKEIGRRDDPTLPADEELENVPPAEDVESVITNNLILFRSIDGLQEQNQKLLKIVRNLGQQMEKEERDYREAMEKEQSEAVREAHEAMQELAAQLDRQKKSSDSIIQAYVKERDALKAMLARAEKAGATRVVNGSGEATGSSPELEKELAEIQSQFDAYRTEMNVDSVRLREEALVAQRETGQLQAALAKANARIEYLTERHRINQDQFSTQAQELDDLNKRNQQLFDRWTRIDLEYGRVSEDLRLAKNMNDQLRSECFNLRAEKKIWEDVQSRLADENKALAMERSHLSDLMSNVQRMHNDLERSGENDRRRLENQLQMMEAQVQDLRTQVSQERDTARNTSLQKDIETREMQARLDKLNQELSKTRESLVIAETSKGHLEERIGDLTKNLQGNAEKLAVYERRPTTGLAPSADQLDLSQEQQLEAEVAELRSAMKVAEFDLAQAKAHVQQFQSISEANETALREFQATHEDYKSSTDAQIAKNESDRQALEERLTAAQQQLVQLTSQLHDIQKQHEEERSAWISDKKTLEDTIVDLSTSEKVSESDRTSREQEVKQQEERTKAAEERYSKEVVAHAESLKALESLKQQLVTVQATVRDHKTAAESATAKLASSQSSWNQQKEALDKEVADLQTRCKDIAEQNNLLHQHLESVSSQAARIRQAADSTPSDPNENDGTDNVDTKISELRSVVSYLRKEKEIVDLQLELSKQETSRLKAQIDHLQQTLSETRQTLSDERERAVESAASAVQHNELVERINQVNILRESNATLRADCEGHSKRAQDLEAKLKAVTQQLEPLQEEVRVAKAELEARGGQFKRLEEENRRWQERNQQLLSKYDRTDPSEMQALKEEVETLKSEKVALEESSKARENDSVTQKTRLEKVEKALRDFKEQYAKNLSSFKTRMGELNAQKSSLVTEKKALEEKVATLENQTQSLQATINTLQAEKSSLEVANPSTTELDATQQTELNALREERDRLLAEKTALMATSSATVPMEEPTDEQTKAWETEKAELIKSRDEALAQAKAVSERSSSTAKHNKAVFEKINHRLQETIKLREADAKNAAAAQEAAVAAAIEQVKSELQTSTTSTSSDDLVKKHQEELRALEDRLVAQHKEELKTAVESAVASTQKTAPVSGAEVDIQAAIAAAIAAHDKEHEAKYAEEIAAAVERGRLEGSSKVKLKDAQIMRVQKQLKDYEAQIQAWKQAGLVPEGAKAPGPASRAPPPPSPSTSTNPASIPPPTALPSAPSAPPSTAALPRKPPQGGSTASAPTASASSSTSGAGRGRGAPAAVARGAVRGFTRGAPGGGRGAAVRQPGQPLSGGITIQGAAKRPASEPAGDDSLAKRLKPAGGGPVPLRRPGPNPPS